MPLKLQANCVDSSFICKFRVKKGLTARFFLVKKRVVRPQPHNPFFYQKKTGCLWTARFFTKKKRAVSGQPVFLPKKNGL